MKQHLLLQAANEIRTLRHANEILQAKVDVMDLFAAVFFTNPHQKSLLMGEDIAWRLEREAEEMEKNNAHKGHAGDRAEESRPSRNGGEGR